MKRSWIKRGVKQLKRSSFKPKVYKPLKRTRLRIVGHSSTSELKIEIQALLRQICLIRDEVCILSHYQDQITPQYRQCGGFRKDGNMIYQAEHLLSRERAIGFTDTRLIVLLCKRHHFFYKKQYPEEYYRVIRKHIGPERSALLDRVQQDYTPYKVDLKLEKLALEKELAELIK